MTYQSLYRRFRPQRFADVLGQDHISATLRNAVRTNKVSHAYLFSGPRGCGKTTSARILAKALNCTDIQDGEPCEACDSCLMVASGASMDVIELDAASNNGVENMRDLVSRAALGTSGRRKVYIVDEVHMLSTAASNALLKTLEEPPDHVVFVLATTDPQKVLPTIRSRTQHFEFRLFPLATLVELLRSVVREANLELDEATIEAVARRGNGSARDALSALDQVAAAGGIEDSFDVSELAYALAERNVAATLGAVDRAVDRGRDPRQLTRDLLEMVREAFLSQMGLTRSLADPTVARLLSPAAATRTLEVLGEALVTMRDSLDPRVTLEVALVRLAHPELDTSPAAIVERLDRVERLMTTGAVVVASAPAAPAGNVPAEASRVAPPAAVPPAVDPRAVDPVAAGPSAFEQLGPSDPSVPAPAAPPEAVSPGILPTLTSPVATVATAPARGDRGGAADGARAALSSARSVGADRRLDPGPSTDGSAPSPRARPRSAAVAFEPEGAEPTVAAVFGGELTVDALNEARETLLGRIERRAKVLLAAGQFVGVDGLTASFALPNAVHRDRSLEWQPSFEAVVQAFTGVAVVVGFVVGADAPVAGGDIREMPDEGDVDLAELVDAPPAPIATTLDHLTQAFPGAEIVDAAESR